MLVLDTMAGSAAAGVLRAGDILLSIDGKSIGTDGTIEFRPRERTAFTFLLQRRQIGDQVALELLREGRKVRTELRLDRRVGAGSLVRGPLYGERPRYYIFGGLAFCPVTVNYAQAWGEDWWNRAPRHLLALLGRGARFEGEEAVVVCSVLRAELNSGYEEIAEDLIVEADGQPVRSLRHLVEIVESRDTGSPGPRDPRGQAGRSRPRACPARGPRHPGPLPGAERSIGERDRGRGGRPHPDRRHLLGRRGGPWPRERALAPLTSRAWLKDTDTNTARGRSRPRG